MSTKEKKYSKDEKREKDEKLDTDEENVTPQICCAQRWVLSYIGFCGFFILFSLRVNFSVAIVCMVRPSNTSSIKSSFDNVINSTSDLNEHVMQDDTCGNIEEASLHERGELDWDINTRSALLSSFFYGYIILGVPGGWLSDRYGGKFVLGTSMLISSILTLLMPICARTNVYLVYAIRISIGLAQALVFPAMHSMWAKWAPPLERSKLTGLCYAGTTVGNVATFSTSGLLCAYGFDNGWGSIFYITGSLGCIWTAAWLYLTSSKPSKHPRITEEERYYIIKSIDNKSKRKTGRVPWLSIMKSSCVWACLCAHVCYNWILYTLMLLLPTFMKDVLKFDIKQNGVLSALPFIGQFICIIVSSHLADFIRIKNLLSTTNTRKVMQIISNVGSGVCLIATGYCTCDTRITAVVLMTIGVTISGFSIGGFLINHVDFAPKYAGMLFGITNLFATIPGMVSPILAGYLTPNNTAEEWRNVFFVCAGFVGFGSIVFGTFASGELQDWANDHTMNMEITVDPKKDKPKTDPNFKNAKKTIFITDNKNAIDYDLTHTKKGSQQLGTELGHVNDGMVPDHNDLDKNNEGTLHYHNTFGKTNADTAQKHNEFGKINEVTSHSANNFERINKGLSYSANN